MGFIKVLPELVANKIAAGEVVERPASIVKEFIDNAFDAGARTISVAVRHGGKSQVLVRDDGCGMDSEDVRACLLRHATSKLQDVDEIERISTMGFRGEALPSIASVSRLSITTRRPQDETATKLLVAGGVIESVTETMAEPGTTVDVTDLFFNTPARKKFLKSDAAEYNAIAEVFNTLALARRDVAFELSRNGAPVASYPAVEKNAERIQQLYGQDFAANLYGLSINKTDFRVEGYIGTPEHTRVNRTGQKFFINGRPVQSPALAAALSRGYEEFLPTRRFPVCVLLLEIESGYIDVNVHPAKREVRIRSERFFLDVLVKAIRQVLREKGFGGTLPAGGGAYDRFRPAAYAAAAAGSARIDFQPLKEARGQWHASQEPKPCAADSFSFTPVLRGENFTPPLFDARQDGRLPFDIVRIVGQVLQTYIVAETSEGLVVFDQHAAHEKVVYEELLKDAPERGDVSQKNIFPSALKLTIQEAALLDEHRDAFERMGFSLNALGGETYAVDAVPASMVDVDTSALLKDVLHELAESRQSRALEKRRQDLAAALACKSHTVKAGRRLDISEMEALVRKLAETDNPHTCPHGRPTFFVMMRGEIEKRFKR
ncbi:MAG: DNA mismatch repair endonuclease MutL [Deltaproteobacteria bacterium]|nr:DNA mismatch repair endonuclease MutL [Deltaproteobacteria bacterium]